VRLSREGKLDEIQRLNPKCKGNTEALRAAIVHNRNEVIKYWLDKCLTNASTIDLALLFKDKSVEELTTNVALPMLTFPSNAPIPGRTYVEIYMPPAYVRNHRCVDIAHCFTHSDQRFTKPMEVQFRNLPYKRGESSDLRLVLFEADEKHRETQRDKKRTQTIDLARFSSTTLEMNPITGAILQLTGRDRASSVETQISIVNHKSADVLRLINGKDFSIVTRIPVLN